MAKIPVADSDVVYLNVGGTVLATKWSTLTQAQGSALAAWFSGRWEDCLDRDEQGHAFLDFDPDLFQPILSFLRSVAICSTLIPGLSLWVLMPTSSKPLQIWSSTWHLKTIWLVGVTVDCALESPSWPTILVQKAFL